MSLYGRWRGLEGGTVSQVVISVGKGHRLNRDLNSSYLVCGNSGITERGHNYYMSASPVNVYELISTVNPPIHTTHQYCPADDVADGDRYQVIP